MEGAEATKLRNPVAIKIAKNGLTDWLIVQMSDLPVIPTPIRRCELIYSFIACHDGGFYAVVDELTVTMVMSHFIFKECQFKLILLVILGEILRELCKEHLPRLAPIVLVFVATF